MNKINTRVSSDNALCAFPGCDVVKAIDEPNYWTQTADGKLYCPRHPDKMIACVKSIETNKKFIPEWGVL